MLGKRGFHLFASQSLIVDLKCLLTQVTAVTRFAVTDQRSRYLSDARRICMRYVVRHTTTAICTPQLMGYASKQRIYDAQQSEINDSSQIEKMLRPLRCSVCPPLRVYRAPTGDRKTISCCRSSAERLVGSGGGHSLQQARELDEHHRLRQMKRSQVRMARALSKGQGPQPVTSEKWGS